ncbi:MAG: ABC transporter permease [Betaproteobacteria bacterium]|nr:ABC transporter permease [Betaproteobacteria bacterium]
MRFEWTVALRFLREGGLQTLLIIAGTTAGISVIVFITGFLGDLQLDLIRRTLGVQPHIIVRPAEEVARPLRDGTGVTALDQVQARAQRLRSVDQWQALYAELDLMHGVRAVSPVAAGPGLVTRGDVNKSITITGIVPGRYAAVTRLDEKIVAGELRLNPGDVVIGTDLAKDLGAAVGDKVRLSTPTSPGDAYRVRGIYELGQRNLNRAYAYVALPAAQALLNLPGGVSSLELAIEDLFGAESFAAGLQARVPHEVESWMRANSQLRTALNNQTVMTLLVRFFLALVVAIGVASVLIVSVVQKTKEIGILRAMGASRGRILRVFLAQGALIGASGALLGSACGYLLTAVMSNVVRADDGTPIFTAHFDPTLYFYTLLGATVLGLAAAVMPARRAANLDPAQAIRL